MRCRHENLVGRAWSEAYPRWYAYFGSRRGDVTADALICLDCGEWLPLGGETDPRVALEIRAAYLAHDEDNAHEFTQIEWCGWNQDEIAIDGSTGERIDVTAKHGWHAGYLARAITETP